MKKIALMISIAAASSLMAANIELYGQAHLSADAVDNDTRSTGTIASNSSRLGVKASYAINDDLTVFGQYEAGLDLTGRGNNDDGNGGNFNTIAGQGSNNGLFTSARDSFVGVSGGFGSVKAGNIGAQNQWIYDYNLFADQIGDLGNLLGAGGVGADRASGTVAYTTPTVNGLQGILTYTPSSSNSGTGDDTAMLAKINYDMGNGLKAGLGYISTDTDVAGQEDPSEVVVTASYAKDIFSVGGGYASMMDPTAAANVSDDRDVWFVGASVSPMKAVTLKAQYADLSSDVANADAQMFAVGVDYDIGGATVYAAYSSTANDSGVNYSATNWGHGQSGLGSGAGGDDPSAVSIGFVYKFGGTVYKD